MTRGWLVVLGLVACSPRSDLVIDRVDPPSGPNTMVTPVRIEGSGFHLPVKSDLDQGGTAVGDMTATVGTISLDGVTWRDEGLIEGSIPAGLDLGTYDVTVTLGGEQGVLPGGFVVTGPGVGGPDAPMSGTNTRAISVNGARVVGGPHADFPLAVALTDPWLRNMASGGNVANANGYDIRFSADAAGTVPLAHEVERYVAATGELLAWVKIPMLSASTVFYIHSGDPNITTSQENRPGVWSSGYAGVWHLAGSAADSTAQNPGTEAATTSATGQLADARGFNGTNSVISIASSASVNDVFNGGGTVEAWFYATGWGGSNFGRLFDRGPSFMVLSMCEGNVPGGSLLFARTFSTGVYNWCTASGTLALNSWTHVAVVYNDASAANVPTVYINGTAYQVTAITTGSGARLADTATLTIGDRTTGLRTFAGTIDEPRLSHAARSAGWIATTYANERDPVGFCILGP